MFGRQACITKTCCTTTELGELWSTKINARTTSWTATELSLTKPATVIPSYPFCQPKNFLTQQQGFVLPILSTKCFQSTVQSPVLVFPQIKTPRITARGIIKKSNLTIQLKHHSNICERVKSNLGLQFIYC